MKIKNGLNLKKCCGTIVSALTLTAVMVVPCLASTTTSFKVNNVNITGNISYIDTNDYNPFTSDSVTVRTNAKASMDNISATATIYFAEGYTIKTVQENCTNKNATSCSVTAKSSGKGIGFRGVGNHYAAHNGKSGSGITGVNW